MNYLSAAQLAAIHRFLLDEQAFAESHHFNITAYTRLGRLQLAHDRQSEVVLTNLARRDLFLDPARQLNNPAITNMSAEALAALAFSQTFVEEKWDHTVPWDGEGNDVFNWIQPELLATPKWEDYINGDFLFRERVRYWFATYKPELLQQHGEGNDIRSGALSYAGAGSECATPRRLQLSDRQSALSANGRDACCGMESTWRSPKSATVSWLPGRSWIPL